MKKMLTGLAVACVVGSLITGSAFAQRGRRGGPRGSVGGGPRRPAAGGPAAGARRRQPKTLTPPGRTGKPPAGAPKIHSPARSHPPGPARSVGDFLGVTRPQTPPRQARDAAALGWIDPANRPFTPAWYAQHPNAWHATHPHADVAVVATAAGLARWLAVPYVPVTTTTSVLETTTVVIDGEVGSEEPSTAGDLVASGEVADDTQYMSIGVFALKPFGQKEATRVIQLAVSREGIIRGSHYDLISDEAQDIQGAVDKDSLQVVWTIGENGKVVFQAPLGELSQPEGKVTVRFPGGKTAHWQTVQHGP